MGNKDEKTFTDIFSSFKEEPETKTQSFSDILNSDKNNEKTSSSNVTFDNLFDQIASSEEETILPKENKQIDFKEEKQDVNFNSLFVDPSEDEVQSDVIDEQIAVEENETKINNNKMASDKTTDNNNPFFEENSESSINTSLGEHINKNEEISNNNVFFQETNGPKQDDEVITPNTIEENIVINNPKDKTLDINPFQNLEGIKEEPNIFTQTSNISDNQLKQEEPIKGENPFTEEKTLQNNPFFEDENNKINEEKNINSNANPFFEEEKKSEENNKVVENNSINEVLNNNIVINEKKETKSKDIVPKSTSPFFEEEKKNEENPFFQNQINLVENKVPDNPNGNIDTTKSKHYNVKIVKKKEPLLKLILGVLSYALFIWLLLIGITLLVYVLDIKIRAAKGDYSSPTFNAYVVLTGSMLPEIEVYDVVVTKKVDAEKLKEGDVITFASADSRFLGTIITHRIIKKNPPSETEGYTFQTRGDNNNVADSALVPENNIFGKVILKIPKLGYLQEFLASRGGWIIVILIPCLTVISYDTVKLIKGLKRKKYKNIKVQK